MADKKRKRKRKHRERAPAAVPTTPLAGCRAPPASPVDWKVTVLHPEAVRHQAFCGTVRATLWFEARRLAALELGCGPEDIEVELAEEATP